MNFCGTDFFENVLVRTGSIALSIIAKQISFSNYRSATLDIAVGALIGL